MKFQDLGLKEQQSFVKLHLIRVLFEIIISAQVHKKEVNKSVV